MAIKKRKVITKIRLYRFQSYVDEIIEFDPHTNSFVGKTDSGKSAISRALYWVLYNRPLKSNKRDDLTTWGERHCFVTVYFSDKTEITRGRKDNENYYLLKKSGEKEREFTGFGFEVPPEILEAHGMYQMQVDDNTGFSLNISQQLEPIFMFEEGGPKRAKTIGKISGADRADGALGVVNSWRKEASTTKKELTKEIKSLTKRLESFDVVDNLEIAINTLEELISLISAKDSVYNELSESLTALKEIHIQKEELIAVAMFESKLLDLGELEKQLQYLSSLKENIQKEIKGYNETQVERQTLNTLISKYRDIEAAERYLADISAKHMLLSSIKENLLNYEDMARQISATTLVLNRADNIDEVENILQIMDQKVMLLNNISSELHSYNNVLGRIEKGSQVISGLEDRLSVAEELYEQYLEVLEECPFCGSKLN